MSVSKAIIIASLILAAAILASSHPYSLVKANDLAVIKFNAITGAAEVCSIRKDNDWYVLGCTKPE